MTQQREIERVLDVWFADGPTEVPDRVFDVVIDRIERQSQRPGWQVRDGSSLRQAVRPLLAIAAVIVVAVVGINLLPSCRTASAARRRRRRPSPAASASAEPSGVPAANSLTRENVGRPRPRHVRPRPDRAEGDLHRACPLVAHDRFRSGLRHSARGVPDRRGAAGLVRHAVDGERRRLHGGRRPRRWAHCRRSDRRDYDAAGGRRHRPPADHGRRARRQVVRPPARRRMDRGVSVRSVPTRGDAVHGCGPGSGDNTRSGASPGTTDFASTSWTTRPAAR